MDDELDPREAAVPAAETATRTPRGDGELMRPGMGKVFKQITDYWSEKATPEQDRAQPKADKGATRQR